MIMPTKDEQEKMVSITLSLPPETVERIDRMAKVMKFSRSKAAQNLLAVGLDLTEDFETFRLMSLAVMIRDKLPLAKKSFKDMYECFEKGETPQVISEK